MRRRLGAAAAVVLASAFVAGAAPGEEALTATTLVPAAEMTPPADLQGYVAAMAPRARVLARAPDDGWSRALALRDLVRRTIPSGATSCFGYARVLVYLARRNGLPLRLVVGSANGLNDYDTHTTAEVWLAKARRWVIVDPTFGGYFTRGPVGRALGVYDLRRALLQGWNGEIVWHAARVRNATPLSANYVDLTWLFRYVGVYAHVAGYGPSVLVPSDSASLSNGVHVPAEPLDRLPPSARVAVTTPPRDYLAARPTSLPLPPAYAPVEASRSTVDLPASVPTPRGGVEVWVSDPDATVAGYALAPVDGGGLSPVYSAGDTTRVEGSGTVSVRVFRVRRFPARRER